MRLPVISGQACIQALQRAGFERRRQKGSHVVLRKGARTVVVPLHRELDRGTLAAVLRQAGIDAAGLRRLTR